MAPFLSGLTAVTGRSVEHCKIINDIPGMCSNNAHDGSKQMYEMYVRIIAGISDNW